MEVGTFYEPVAGSFSLMTSERETIVFGETVTSDVAVIPSTEVETCGKDNYHFGYQKVLRLTSYLVLAETSQHFSVKRYITSSAIVRLVYIFLNMVNCALKLAFVNVVHLVVLLFPTSRLSPSVLGILAVLNHQMPTVVPSHFSDRRKSNPTNNYFVPTPLCSDSTASNKLSNNDTNRS